MVHALEQEREDAVLEQWQSLYPWMAAGLLQFKPYGEFRQELLRPQVRHSDKSFEEITDEMMRVVVSYESQKAGE